MVRVLSFIMFKLSCLNLINCIILQVLEVKEEGSGAPQYYVHYLGWNTRHDEWIPRSCVAGNITWSQNRARKGRAAVTKEIKEKERKEKLEDKEKKKEDKEDKKEKVFIIIL